MRISDWSSDVCSSDLDAAEPREEIASGGIEQQRCYEDRPDHRQTCKRKERVEHDYEANGQGEQGRDRCQKNDDSGTDTRSEEHTSELQSLMRNSYAVFCLKKQQNVTQNNTHTRQR